MTKQDMFFNACNSNDLLLVKKLLIDPEVDPASHDSLILRQTAEKGFNNIVKLLLEDGRVDPADDDSNSLHWAAENGHTDVIKLLLEDGRVDPFTMDSYALRWAALSGHIEVVVMLLKNNTYPHKTIKKITEWANVYSNSQVLNTLRELY
jgi:ankyrin repeat protein